MRRSVLVAAVAAGSILAGGVASADVRPAAGLVGGPFVKKVDCLAKQNAAAKDGWKITVPCHESGKRWYFKAVR
jgi:hypothetical protein